MIKYKGVFMKIKRILIIISSLITLYSCGTIHVNADIVLVNKQNTIKSITHKYKISKQKLLEINHLDRNHKFKIGETLITPSKNKPENQKSVYEQFIDAGGTPQLWADIVLPESHGNPNATSPNGYHGLGQTKQSWGFGSIKNQTQGMINYAINKYGSIEAAIVFRQSHGWW